MNGNIITNYFCINYIMQKLQSQSQSQNFLDMKQEQDQSHMTIIDDDRITKHFSNTTFSKYSKKKVENEMLKTLKNECIEETNYWCAELLCSGHFTAIWEIFLCFFCKNIHISNPKICVYLGTELDKMKKIIKSQNDIFNNSNSTILDIRNIPEIRKKLIEICVVLCYSCRKVAIEPIKIHKEYEFQMDFVMKKIKANSYYVQSIFKSSDPNELFVPCNELYFMMLQKNITGCSYWLEWLIEFDNFCRLKKNPLICHKRDDFQVAEKYFTHITWLIWDIFCLFLETQFGVENKSTNHNNTEIYYLQQLGGEGGKKNGCTFIQKVYDNLLTLFCFQFSIASLKKRKFAFYFLLELFIETVDLMSIPPILATDKQIFLDALLQNNDVIYKQIKKAEFKNAKYALYNIDNL